MILATVAPPDSPWSALLDAYKANVEKASGGKMEDLLEARVFGPLGMTDTDVEVRAHMAPRLAGVKARGESGHPQAQDHAHRAAYLHVISDALTSVAAILAIGAVTPKPVVRGGQVVVRIASAVTVEMLLDLQESLAKRGVRLRIVEAIVGPGLSGVRLRAASKLMNDAVEAERDALKDALAKA